MKNIILFISIFVILIIAISIYKNFKKEKPLVIIMMGPPGCGKGTQSTELSKSLNLPHISTGDLFRENIRNQTELGKKAKGLIDEGNLVPDDLVVQMLFDYINSKGYDKTGYILDGFPRTLNQAEILNKKLGSKYQKLALNLQIGEDKLVERITNRLICKSCGTPFHKIYLPPKQDNICDKCGSELYQRKDDTEEVLKKRLEIYNKDTQPLLDFYKNQNVLNEVDSSVSKETVFENLLNSIKQFKKLV